MACISQQVLTSYFKILQIRSSMRECIALLRFFSWIVEDDQMWRESSNLVLQSKTVGNFMISMQLNVSFDLNQKFYEARKQQWMMIEVE